MRKAFTITAAPEDTRRFIGRCIVKGCKCKPLAFDCPTEWRTHYPRPGYGEPRKYRAANTNFLPYVFCVRHKHQISWQEVKGTLTDTKCDARCTNAKGHSCDCSCGGANHGSGWL